MTDTTNTITATPDLVVEIPIELSVGDTIEEYVMPTVLHTPGNPIASLVASIIRLNQRVEELETDLAAMAAIIKAAGGDRG